MRLIIDTNSIIAALVKDSTSRKIVLNPKFKFYCTEHVFKEIEEHFEEITKKTKNVEKTKELLELIKKSLSTIDEGLVVEHISKADKLIRDKEDIPLIALALAIPNQGIWTSDKDFLEQQKIKIWTTKELLELIE